MLEQASARVGRTLEALRLQLAHPEKLLGLSVLGLATGVLAGAVIVVFRFLVEYTQEGILPGTGPENYEALPPLARLALPMAGGMLLAVMYRWFARGHHRLGVARVMERMARHQGHFPAREFFLQFFGASLAIISGHSVGREGPHVFLGAASGSLLGQRLHLPNNSIRTLVACGAAAAIGASFNTPLAGVVFALEVVMMEYTVASFIPVILACVSATLLSNLVFGHASAFTMPPLAEAQSGTTMALVMLLGLAVGALSASLNHALEVIGARTREVAPWWRMLAAGAGMAVVGFCVPQVMGIGYDTVQLALNGEPAIRLLLLLVVAKMIAASISLGLGVPGGVIGPSLFVGAMAGALIARLVLLISPEADVSIGVFALLGMGAAMSASLQAPLAGLTAMFELTHNPQIILPGMLAVVVSGLTAKEFFGKDSLFVTQLTAAGLDYRSTPVMQALRRRGVASVMDVRLVSVPAVLGADACREALHEAPQWLLLEGDAQDPRLRRVLLAAADLARHLETSGAEGDAAPGAVELMEIPAERRLAAPIAVQATLQEALELLDGGECEALYVADIVGARRAGDVPRVYGVLTRGMIERTYLP